MKTGILVHGCNLGAENWRHIAWGDPPDDFGAVLRPSRQRSEDAQGQIRSERGGYA